MRVTVVKNLPQSAATKLAPFSEKSGKPWLFLNRRWQQSVPRTKHKTQPDHIMKKMPQARKCSSPYNSKRNYEYGKLWNTTIS